KDKLIGATCVPSDLLLANTDQKFVVPPALAPEYPEAILKLLAKVKPDFLHVQNDFEVLAISQLRHEVEALGIKLFIPSHKTIENTVDKYKSYEIWKRAGVKVPETIELHTPEDLKRAFKQFGPKVW